MPANIIDSTVLPDPLRGNETRVGDRAYPGQRGRRRCAGIKDAVGQ
jgi:hypothetical protein